jgi:hypothetical protein
MTEKRVLQTRYILDLNHNRITFGSSLAQIFLALEDGVQGSGSFPSSCHPVSQQQR